MAGRIALGGFGLILAALGALLALAIPDCLAAVAGVPGTAGLVAVLGVAMAALGGYGVGVLFIFAAIRKGGRK